MTDTEEPVDLDEIAKLAKWESDLLDGIVDLGRLREVAGGLREKLKRSGDSAPTDTETR